MLFEGFGYVIGEVIVCGVYVIMSLFGVVLEVVGLYVCFVIFNDVG